MTTPIHDQIRRANEAAIQAIELMPEHRRPQHRRLLLELILAGHAAEVGLYVSDDNVTDEPDGTLVQPYVELLLRAFEVTGGG